MYYPGRAVLIDALLSCIAVCSQCIGTSAATAQTAPPAGVDASTQAGGGTKPQLFTAALQQIAVRFHVTFVAEGVPLPPVAPNKDGIIPTNPATLDASVRQVADAYDYTVERKDTVFAFKKRYSSPHDLPALTMGECLRTLHEVDRVAALYNPHVPDDRYAIHQPGVPDPLVGSLAASFTPAQLQALQASALHFNDLSQAQQSLVRRFALFFFVQRHIETADQVQSWLTQADKEVVLRWGTLGGLTHLFGFEMPEGPRRRRFFEPLSGPYGTISNFSGTPIYRQPQPGLEDLTSPPPPGAAPAQTATIGEAVAALERRSGKDTNVSVETELQDKPITLVGADNSTPEQLMWGLSVAYGLQLHISKNPADTRCFYELTFTPTIKPSSVTDLPQALCSALPDCLRRALHVQESLTLDAELQDISSLSYRSVTPVGKSRTPQRTAEETPAELAQAMRERSELAQARRTVESAGKEIPQLEAAPTDIRLAAIMHLRQIVEPLLQSSPSSGVAFSKLSNAQHDAFAAVIMSEFLRTITPLISHPTPTYFFHFDKVVLTGGFTVDSNGKRYFSLFIALPTPDGKTVEPQVGISSIPYDN